MKKISSPNDLYTEFVRDMYSAEVLEVPALRFFERNATSLALCRLLHKHVGETRMQILRLEDLIEQYHKESLIEEHCRTMQWMINEARDLVTRCEPGDLKDFAIVASLRRIKNCELLVYQMLERMADDLALTTETDILEQNHREEAGMLEAITQLRLPKLINHHAKGEKL